MNNLKEFIAYAKKKPGKLNYGSAGNGSAGHLAMEYLKMASETFMLHVPYRGTGPQLTDLLAGRLDAASVGAPAVLQFIKTGKLRCIASGTTQRIAQLPDVPTVAEQGYPGFEMTQWYGLLAPASLPQVAGRQARRRGGCRGQAAFSHRETQRPMPPSAWAARRRSSLPSSPPSNSAGRRWWRARRSSPN